jgi:hypothetical protein
MYDWRWENYHIRMVGGRDEKPTLPGCWLGEIKTIISGWWEEEMKTYVIRMVGGSG